MRRMGGAFAPPVPLQILSLKLLSAVFCFAASLNCAFAVQLTVSGDGSKDYSLIQMAMESACDQDTVLVYPGHYTENIDFLGKSISLCSLEATTGDSLYIANTVIDGAKNGSCIAIRNGVQNATLRGFTLTNGSGYPFFADHTVRGGGILISSAAQVNLVNCEIYQNTAAHGAGIFCFNSSLYVSGLKIHDNYALVRGGGMVIHGSYQLYPTVIFDPVNRCSIYSNFGVNPVDILIVDMKADIEINLDMFTVSSANPFYYGRQYNTPLFYGFTDAISIQRAYRSEVNQDLFVSPAGNDANSGLSPSQAMKSICKAMHRIMADSLNVKTLHVLPGSYREGLNEQILPIPMKSHVKIIGAGSNQTQVIASSQIAHRPASIFAGDCCTNTSLSGFTLSSELPESNWPLSFGNLTRNAKLCDIKISDMKVFKDGALFVDDWEASIIDSLIIENVSAEECLLNFNNISSGTIMNSVFSNISSAFQDPNTPGDDSWGIPIFYLNVADSFTLERCQFRNITVQNNQYTFSLAYDPTSTEVIPDINVNNCLFAKIRTNWNNGILFTGGGSGRFNITNCTFFDNYGSFAAVGIDNQIALQNNVFYNPDALYELLVYPVHPLDDGLGVSILDYNNINRGISAVLYSAASNNLNWGEHNISQDPGFYSTDQDNPHFLSFDQNSPCLNAGTPDINYLDLPPCDLAGNLRIWNSRIDMGCYEFGATPWVAIDDPVIPPVPAIILSAYPNPFNTVVNLLVDLSLSPQAAKGSITDASIDIFNIRGQSIRSITVPPPINNLLLTKWDGQDSRGNACANGIYFLKLSINGQATGTRKITLIR